MRRETYETLAAQLASNRRTTQILALAILIAVIVFAVRGSPATSAALLAGSIAGGLLAGQWFYLRRMEEPLAKGVRTQGLEISSDARDVVALIDLPALVIDTGGTIRVFNRQAQLIYPQIQNGQPLIQISRNPGLLDAVARATAEHSGQTGEMTERGPTGRRLRATVAPFAARPADASAAGDGKDLYLIQLRDLSEQDRLAQLRSDFIANASHELRTPLASLKGFVETLQGPASQDEKARTRFLKIMAAQSARMARILDDLLSLSRIEMRAHVRPTTEVDINGIVRASVHGLEPIADDAKIELTLTTTPQRARVLGDDDELEQVFQNLIENAIKYGHEGGKVDVVVGRSATRQGQPDHITITITDDGPGIAEEHLPRLTERFYRVDTATSRERGGTGLGLAIVKHILNRHAGELEITSQVGRGSTFTVVLDASA